MVGKEKQNKETVPLLFDRCHSFDFECTCVDVVTPDGDGCQTAASGSQVRITLSPETHTVNIARLRRLSLMEEGR